MPRKILAFLAPRARRVLELRFGLDGASPSTLDQVAVIFGVTRERIRQIQNLSLKKLERRQARSRCGTSPEASRK
jgi:RNA polymerase primary sigma factor